MRVLVSVLVLVCNHQSRFCRDPDLAPKFGMKARLALRALSAEKREAADRHYLIRSQIAICCPFHHHYRHCNQLTQIPEPQLNPCSDSFSILRHTNTSFKLSVEMRSQKAPSIRSFIKQCMYCGEYRLPKAKKYEHAHSSDNTRAKPASLA